MRFLTILLLWLTHLFSTHKSVMRKSPLIFSSASSVRVAGIQGIQGVVRKMVSDQLILEVHESNMDKIVLPLLFNMCDK